MYANILEILAVGNEMLENIGLGMMFYGHICNDSFTPTIYMELISELMLMYFDKSLVI